MILLDTDVLIDIQRGHPSAVAWIGSQGLSDFKVSGAAAMELLAGSRNSLEHTRSANFLDRLPIEWLCERDNRLALELVRTYRLSTGLGFADFLIAAQALNNEATLFTFNVKHFGSIPRLDVIAPYVR